MLYRNGCVVTRREPICRWNGNTLMCKHFICLWPVPVHVCAGTCSVKCPYRSMNYKQTCHCKQSVLWFIMPARDCIAPLISLLLLRAIYQCPNQCGLGGTSPHNARPLPQGKPLWLYRVKFPYHFVNNPSHRVMYPSHRVMYPSHGADHSSHRVVYHKEQKYSATASATQWCTRKWLRVGERRTYNNDKKQWNLYCRKIKVMTAERQREICMPWQKIF